MVAQRAPVGPLLTKQEPVAQPPPILSGGFIAATIDELIGYALPPAPVLENPRPVFSFVILGQVVSARPADRSLVVPPVPITDAPRSALASLPPGQNVRAPVDDSLQTVQELPGQPPSVLRVGKSGPDVRPSQIEDSISVFQEYPWHPSGRVLIGVIGPNVRSPVDDSLFTFQELPGHPGSRFVIGVTGPNVRAQIEDSIAIFQEPKAQPAPLLRVGILGQIVSGARVEDSISIFQEMPRHPAPLLRVGAVGPNVRPSQIDDSISIFQEPSSRQPVPLLRVGVLDRSGGRVEGWKITIETPGHPAPLLRVGVVGPNVARGLRDWIQTSQELPAQPPPYFRSAPIYTASVFLTPVTRLILGRQELPRHPDPALVVGVRGPNVASGIRNWIALTQEPPYHPASYLRSAPIYTASVFLTPELRALLTRQELPRHPDPVLRPGRQGPDVRPPGLDIVLTRQELPAQPLPFLVGISRPNLRSPAIDIVLVRQEPAFGSTPQLVGIVPQGAARAALDRIIINPPTGAEPSRPQLIGLVQPLVLPPTIRRIIVAPGSAVDRPLAFLRASIVGPAPPPSPLLVRVMMTSQQELPGHPRPLLLSLASLFRLVRLITLVDESLVNSDVTGETLTAAGAADEDLE